VWMWQAFLAVRRVVAGGGRGGKYWSLSISSIIQVTMELECLDINFNGSVDSATNLVGGEG